MSFDKEILRVLAEVGTGGLSVQKVSIHVHNACNTFFNVVTYEDVHSYVSQFLIRNSKNPNSVIEKTEYRGVYRLNTNSSVTRQLMLQFEDKNTSVTEEKGRDKEDSSLSFF